MADFSLVGSTLLDPASLGLHCFQAFSAIFTEKCSACTHVFKVFLRLCSVVSLWSINLILFAAFRKLDVCGKDVAKLRKIT